MRTEYFSDKMYKSVWRYKNGQMEITGGDIANNNWIKSGLPRVMIDKITYKQARAKVPGAFK